ncbi:glycosyltransferase [Paenibacillus sp. sgz500958]|uniref:glycosyltransferase n=1 Tax=Paenibacillus sp. sgz500958 TaxID=3242475 RepID=UPI0036D3A298
MNASISLCMIVKDEEKTLSRCLESVKDKVDQIIIVDTGSSDNTINIARQYTAEIHTFAWTDSFAEARNFALRLATKEYILVLDADEYLDMNADLQQDLSTRLDYYLLDIKNYHSYSESFMHNAVRLFINDHNLFYENRLHEHLNIIGNLTLKSGKANTLIHHTGYSVEVMGEKEKLKRNLPIMQKSVQENPDAYNLYNMGKTYLSLNDFNKAVDYFKRAYPLSTNRVFLPELLTKLAFSLGELERSEEGVAILNDAVHLFPDETEMRYVQGMLFNKMGYYRDALSTFQECVKMGDTGSLVTEGSGGYRSLELISGIYEDQRKLGQAFDSILQSLQAKKNYAPALKRYFKITLKARIPLKEVYTTIKQIYNVENITDLQLLLDVLYGLKHPLLQTLLFQYKITPPINVKARAMLLDKQYEQARQEWIEAKGFNIQSDNGIDLVLLAYILKDAELLKLAARVMNWSQRESKVMDKLIAGEEINPAHLTGPVESLLLEMARFYIILEELDCVESISKLLLTAKLDTKIKLCVLLADYGYDQAAFDQLVIMYEERPTQVQVLELLGDLCCRMGYRDDAEVIYSRLMEQKPTYSSYERSYNLYDSKISFEGMRRIGLAIKKQFPLSQWNQSMPELPSNSGMH